MKQLFDPKTITVGSEFEFGDIQKTIEGKHVEIPEHLGKWENCENCVINLTGEYRGVAVDPLGINPPVGGEINVVPAVGWEKAAEKFIELTEFFNEMGTPPKPSFLTFNHIHIHVPGLSDSLEGLARVGKWIEDNQHTLIEATCSYDKEAFERVDVAYGLFGLEEHIVNREAEIKAKCTKSNRIRGELMDGGRKHPDWLVERLKNPTSFQQWCKDHQSGESRKGMPIRYGINTYAMKHIKTIEFRCFRASAEPDMIRQQFECAFEVINAMVNTGESMQSIFDRHTEWKPWPKVWFSSSIWNSYIESKIEGHLLQNKNRVLLDVS